VCGFGLVVASQVARAHWHLQPLRSADAILYVGLTIDFLSLVSFLLVYMTVRREVVIPFVGWALYLFVCSLGSDLIATPESAPYPVMFTILIRCVVFLGLTGVHFALVWGIPMMYIAHFGRRSE
jgi:hypothetical protein